jgi:putative NIF3 family GTP cyclohydrolase 1 type 2
MAILFFIGILIIVLLNVDATKKIVPLKKWHGVANLVAAGMIVFWGITSGALMSN